MPYIPFEKQDEYAMKLYKGLNMLKEDFVARLCPICQGKTRYEQTYCDGPNGYFKSRGRCDYCGETGLMVGSKPASESVLNQVLLAAEKSS